MSNFKTFQVRLYVMYVYVLPSGVISIDLKFLSLSNVRLGRNASIVLLDERRLEMLIRPRLEAGELLDLVANHCQLKEKEYFGLAVVDDNGQYTW